jgi:hypothetical protein
MAFLLDYKGFLGGFLLLFFFPGTPGIGRPAVGGGRQDLQDTVCRPVPGPRGGAPGQPEE